MNDVKLTIFYQAGMHRIGVALDGRLKESPAHGYIPPELKSELLKFAQAMYSAGFKDATDKSGKAYLELMLEVPDNPYL